jgi:ABC-2 type transport system permease protein
MKQWVNTIKAFLVRDAVTATSYRLNFFFQIISLFFTSVAVFFVSKLVGNQPSVIRYGGYLPFAILGIATTNYFTTGFDSFALAIRNEQTIGTLEYVLLTPARLSRVIVGSSIWSFCWTSINAIVLILTTSLLFDFRLKGNYLLALLILVLTVICFSCLGILSASFVMVYKRGDPLKFLAGTATYLFGGVTFPISIFPGWMQKISYLLPVTHGLSALREVLLCGASLRSVWPQILILIVYVLIGVPLSLASFNKAVNIARSEGSLLHY